MLVVAAVMVEVEVVLLIKNHSLVHLVKLVKPIKVVAVAPVLRVLVVHHLLSLKEVVKV
jgi:hypothetical protein